MQSSIRVFGAVLAGAMILSPCALAQTAARIGAAAAVRNQVTAGQTGAERHLATGNPVFQNEAVRTGADSVAQLLFSDQTSLSLGPRSEVRLDRYVYDPNRSAGDVAVSFTTGALRFVTGSQNPQNYQVRTPVATIGVRGTVVDLLMLDGRMYGLLDEGRAIFTLPNGDEVELTHPGMAFEFFSDGSASAPFMWRGRYESSLGAATFPLFGNPFADTPGLEGGNNPDDATNRTDELAAENSRWCPWED
jgi:ferric-dicitrate binding protein FerR (iron transport regulator)